MAWLGMIAGVLLGWLVTEVFGPGSNDGGVVVLSGIGGGLLGRLQGRLQALAAEIAALKQALPVPMPAAAPELVVKTEAVAAGLVPRPALPPTPPPRPAPRPQPDESSLAVTSSLGASLLAWFRGGNTIVRVAVLLLFIGVAFLLRYAAEHSHVPLEWRLAGVALGGVALTALGFKLTTKRRGYGLSLQGAGVGIVYLVLFAAYRLYNLLPTTLTFALLAAMAAITTVLSLRQDALPLAALGFGGAFLAPVLTSTGQGSHVALFSYQLLLNGAIALIARHKAWKLLNLEGFAFTFGIAAAWGWRAYTPEQFWSAEPFLVANFALYLFIAVQYTQRMLNATEQSPALPLVDGSLLFGTPLVAFGLQAAMLREQPLALAFSAAVLAGIYLLLGQYLWRQAGQKMLLLVEGLAALGLVFLALVTPLALDARWTSAAWAVQGLGVLWIALRQRRWWAAGMGLLLQLGAALSFWASMPGTVGSWLFFNSAFLGALLLALAALTSARLLLRARTAGSMPTWLTWPAPEAVMLALGIVQLWFGGWIELDAWQQTRLDSVALACGWTALLVLACEVGQVLLRWPTLRWPARLLMVFTLLASAAANLDRGWPRWWAGLGGVEVLALLALGVWRLRRAVPDNRRINTAEHLSLAWYAMLQGGLFVYTLGAHFVARHEGWTPAAAVLLPTLLALALLTRPPAGLAAAYRRWLCQPWLAALCLWVLVVNVFCDAAMAPLPYLPLLNPLDLAHGLVLIYALRLNRDAPAPRAQIIGPALVFVWLNGLLIRTLHHGAGTPMWTDGALNAALVQTGLSVLWTLSAQVTMLYATRRAPAAQARPMWMAGGALLALVVLKLFSVDLSSLGSLARIVSFMAVGGLMLVIGYVSPLPPASSTKAVKP